MSGERFDRSDAPLRRFKEAAYWYHAKKRQAWTPEFDYHLRAFAQAFASSVEALQRLWTIQPLPNRYEEMKSWWEPYRTNAELQSKIRWIQDLRTREFHTLSERQPPSERSPAGFRDMNTGGFFAFLHHRLPGDDQTIEKRINPAFFEWMKLLIEFGDRFQTWTEADVREAMRFPDSLRANQPKKPPPAVYDSAMGAGPYEPLETTESRASPKKAHPERHSDPEV